jgi:hypothetical protein
MPEREAINIIGVPAIQLMKHCRTNFHADTIPKELKSYKVFDRTAAGGNTDTSAMCPVRSGARKAGLFLSFPGF